MEEKCKIISEGETLSLVTSGSGADKDTIIYVIPFEGNETLFQSDRTLNQVRFGFFFFILTIICRHFKTYFDFLETRLEFTLSGKQL